jgi:hypothetical protein
MAIPLAFGYTLNDTKLDVQVRVFVTAYQKNMTDEIL